MKKMIVFNICAFNNTETMFLKQELLLQGGIAHADK